MACQSAVRKKVPTSLGKLRPPGTPVRVTRSVSRVGSERVDSEETDVRGEERAEDVRCEERAEVVLSRTEAGRTETVKHQVLTTLERGKTAPVSDKAASGIPGPSQDQVGEVTETVSCGCGVNENDGEPLLQCEECEGIIPRMSNPKMSNPRMSNPKMSNDKMSNDKMSNRVIISTVPGESTWNV